MKKKLIGIVLLLVVGFAFGQVINREGWRDFNVFTGLMDSTDSAIQDVYNHIISLESEKAAIMDDADRLAEMKKIIDCHPDYDLTEIVAKLAAFKVLKNYLLNNGYVEN